MVPMTINTQYPCQRRHFSVIVFKVSRIERKEKPPGLTKITICGGKLDYWPPLTMRNVKKRFSETTFKLKKLTAVILKLVMILCWLIVDPRRHSSRSADCRKPGASDARGALQTVAVAPHAAPALHFHLLRLMRFLFLFSPIISPLQCTCVCVCVRLSRLMVSHNISHLGWLQLANRIKF